MCTGLVPGLGRTREADARPARSRRDLDDGAAERGVGARRVDDERDARDARAVVVAPAARGRGLRHGRDEERRLGARGRRPALGRRAVSEVELDGRLVLVADAEAKQSDGSIVGLKGMRVRCTPRVSLEAGNLLVLDK